MDDIAKFESYEQVILTGQMPDDRVPSFLDENPEFAVWYKERMAQRRAAKDTTEPK